jgi:Resolvase, N terminal domain
VGGDEGGDEAAGGDDARGAGGGPWAGSGAVEAGGDVGCGVACCAVAGRVARAMTAIAAPIVFNLDTAGSSSGEGCLTPDHAFPLRVAPSRAGDRPQEPLTERIDTSSATGKLVFHIIGALAEFERNLIKERTLAGLSAARARGRLGGRPKLNPKAGKVALARKLYADKSNAISARPSESRGRPCIGM